MNLKVYLILDTPGCDDSPANRQYCDQIAAWVNEMFKSEYYEEEEVATYLTYRLSALQELAPDLPIYEAPAVVFYDADTSTVFYYITAEALTEENFKLAIGCYTMPSSCEGGLDTWGGSETDGWDFEKWGLWKLPDFLDNLFHGVPKLGWLLLAVLGGSKAMDSRSGGAAAAWGGAGALGAAKFLAKPKNSNSQQ
jgi:hypothetical protein